MTLCRIVTGIFAIMWAFALLVLAIGTFGWFGQERDPLSAVYLVVLGLPWNRLADIIEPLAPVLVIMSPGLNLFLIVAFCRRFGRRN